MPPRGQCLKVQCVNVMFKEACLTVCLIIRPLSQTRPEKLAAQRWHLCMFLLAMHQHAESSTRTLNCQPILSTSYTTESRFQQMLFKQHVFIVFIQQLLLHYKHQLNQSALCKQIYQALVCNVSHTRVFNCTIGTDISYWYQCWCISESYIHIWTV